MIIWLATTLLLWLTGIPSLSTFPSIVKTFYKEFCSIDTEGKTGAELDQLLSRWMEEQLPLISEEYGLLPYWKSYQELIPLNAKSYLIFFVAVAMRLGVVKRKINARVINVSNNERALILSEYLFTVGKTDTYLYQALIDGSVDLSLIGDDFSPLVIEAILNAKKNSDLTILLLNIGKKSLNTKENNTRTNDVSS